MSYTVLQINFKAVWLQEDQIVQKHLSQPLMIPFYN